jgi:uncharacterized repeat protein (TIGR01451 family)
MWKPQLSPVAALVGRILCALMAVLLCPSLAQAQTINQYSNTTTGTINNATTCAAPLVRNFTVGTSFTVSDVDLAVLAAHTWRGDLQMTLQSPAGTRVQLVNGDTNNISGDNFNVRLNDSGTQTVNTDGNAVNHSTTAPPYQNNFAPNAALSAFAGQNSSGTWRLEICDLFPTQDNGTFTRADLYLTVAPTNFADLSLAKTVSNATPASGTNINYTLTASSAAASNLTATGVTVLDVLPLGVTFVSASGSGSYNAGTGVWTVGTLAPGASASITITVTVNATSGAIVTNGAEISASSVADLDSTPNNGSTLEDDDAFVSFTVSGGRTAGTPPTLVCPVGTVLLDWNSHPWTSGSPTGSATLAGLGVVNFAVTTQGTFTVPLNTTSNILGGQAAGQLSLYQNIEYTNRSQTTTTTVTLPTAVPGVQFTVFDVDFAANDFADKLTITGSFNGAPVTPVLTNNVANYVTGNVAIGDVTATDSTANGNVVVTFSLPVDTILITYGNHTTAPADPDGQAISIYDFNFCRPQANLSVTKISNVVSDGVSASNPKAVAGAVMRYCILVSNAGSATATGVSVSDTLPANMTFVAGSIVTGANCGSAATAEDDDATGADESDPYGVSFAGTTLTGTAASLGPSAGFAIAFNATIN